MSGCGGGVPKLTSAEQAEVDKIIATHGRNALDHYMGRVSSNEDENLVLKYVKFFISEGADVNAGGGSPLLCAAGRDFTEVVNFLAPTEPMLMRKTEE